MRFILAMIVMAMLQSLSVNAEDPLPTTIVTVLPDVKIKAELALDDATRAKGLMFRKSLAENAGMLFVFPVLDFQSFWMKNTLIPLDMIWLNEYKEVIYFVTADPCKSDPCGSYGPPQKAMYVLEVNGGFAKKHHLKLGQQFQFELPQEAQQS
ncbi:MAG TPA: DUF192 domain-containing protein [Acidobacteriota bacterium]|nr:DUF192 domain-containing protein [Acidobacteriota bacterium]